MYIADERGGVDSSDIDRSIDRCGARIQHEEGSKDELPQVVNRCMLRFGKQIPAD